MNVAIDHSNETTGYGCWQLGLSRCFCSARRLHHCGDELCGSIGGVFPRSLPDSDLRSTRTCKIAEPRIAHSKALVAAKVPHVTLHGLRRSFHLTDLLRVWHAKIEGWMREQAGIAFRVESYWILIGVACGRASCCSVIGVHCDKIGSSRRQPTTPTTTARRGLWPTQRYNKKPLLPDGSYMPSNRGQEAHECLCSATSFH